LTFDVAKVEGVLIIISKNFFSLYEQSAHKFFGGFLRVLKTGAGKKIACPVFLF
jgi:hypothetical protein